jgi:hypothetical protein
MAEVIVNAPARADGLCGMDAPTAYFPVGVFVVTVDNNPPETGASYIDAVALRITRNPESYFILSRRTPLVLIPADAGMLLGRVDMRR